MGVIILGIFSKFLPNRKPVVIKSNVPKEKETIQKSFGIYCKANHDVPSDKKLCSKCTALLTNVMIKIGRCPYGKTKPNCDACKNPCFGDAQTKQFREIMSGSKTKMLLKHPIMAIRHKFYGMRKEEAPDTDKKPTVKRVVKRK